MSHPINDQIFEEIEVYLEGYGLKVSDLMKDEGGYFHEVEYDTGNPQDEGYHEYSKKKYLDSRYQDLLSSMNYKYGYTRTN